MLPLAAFHPPLVCELLNSRFAAGARHRGGRFLPGTIQGGLFANNYPVAGVRIFLPPLAGNKLICICELASSCICKQGNATKSRWTPGGGWSYPRGETRSGCGHLEAARELLQGLWGELEALEGSLMMGSMGVHQGWLYQLGCCFSQLWNSLAQNRHGWGICLERKNKKYEMSLTWYQEDPKQPCFQFLWMLAASFSPSGLRQV